MEVIKDYTAHIDSKKRLTLRGSKYDYYEVKEYDNGYVVLEPRELVKPEGISNESLKEMDTAILNLKKGKVSAPVDLTDF